MVIRRIGCTGSLLSLYISSSLSIQFNFFFLFSRALFKLAGWPTRAIIARGSQWVPKDIIAISLSRYRRCPQSRERASERSIKSIENIQILVNSNQNFKEWCKGFHDFSRSTRFSPLRTALNPKFQQKLAKFFPYFFQKFRKFC